jgi:hypothetical protein
LTSSSPEEPARPPWGYVNESYVFHEAGHAVVARAAGWVIKKIAFNRIELEESACEYVSAKLETPEEYCTGLRVALAGVVAEAIHGEDDPQRRACELLKTPRSANPHPWDDRVMVQEWQTRADCSIPTAVRQAEELLRNRWGDVEAVVHALDDLARRDPDPILSVALTGDDLDRVLSASR